MHVRFLEECLTHGKHSICVSQIIVLLLLFYNFSTGFGGKLKGNTVCEGTL